jgi:hypothetical protein
MNKAKEHILKRIADKDPELIIVTTTNGCTFIYERENASETILIEEQESEMARRQRI